MYFLYCLFCHLPNARIGFCIFCSIDVYERFYVVISILILDGECTGSSYLFMFFGSPVPQWSVVVVFVGNVSL